MHKSLSANGGFIVGNSVPKLVIRALIESLQTYRSVLFICVLGTEELEEAAFGLGVVKLPASPSLIASRPSGERIIIRPEILVDVFPYVHIMAHTIPFKTVHINVRAEVYPGSKA